MDEQGDARSGLAAIGEGTQLRVIDELPFPHSLAWVYSQVTELLGFTPHKDEQKTQWLSLSGAPEFENLFLGMTRSEFFAMATFEPPLFHARIYRASGVFGFFLSPNRRASHQSKTSRRRDPRESRSQRSSRLR